MLRDRGRMFEPPVTQLASVEQQETKQAGSEVKSDTDVHWLRPGGRTGTGCVTTRHRCYRDAAKRFYSVK